MAGTAVREQLVPMTATICGSATSAWASVWPSCALLQPASVLLRSTSWPATCPRSLIATCTPVTLSRPSEAVAPVIESAVARTILSPLATFTQPNLSALHTAVGSPEAAVEPLGALLPPVLLVHATRVSSSAASTALSRKSLCIRSPPGSSGRREVSRPGESAAHHTGGAFAHASDEPLNLDTRAGLAEFKIWRSGGP